MAKTTRTRKPPKASRKAAPKPPPPRPHLKDTGIKAMPLPAEGARIVYDDMVPGFGIRVTAKGAKSFVLNYFTRAGRERRYTIGQFPNWVTVAARQKARDLKREIDNGGDPLAAVEEERTAPTMAELADRFESEHLPRRRAGTQADYRSILSKHIRPHFGKHVKVADVTIDDVERLHRRITHAGKPYRANRVVAVLSKMLTLAKQWKMRPDNPAQGIERNYEAKRKRYLNGDELRNLLAALATHSDQRSANVIRLLLLTGARRGEVLSMRWADIDLSAGKWVKPASTTKQKAEHEAPLNAPARALLAEIADAQASKRGLPEFVFPGAGANGHVVEIKRSWRTLCRAAGISNLRIHDLRHSFASQLASGGASLPLIGALLGHSNPTTTARYAHLFDDPQRQAAERVGAVIAAAANPPVQPVAMSKGKRRR
jgi:integrase